MSFFFLSRRTFQSKFPTGYNFGFAYLKKRMCQFLSISGVQCQLEKEKKLVLIVHRHQLSTLLSVPPNNSAMIYKSENIRHLNSLSYHKRTFHALKEINGNVNSVGYIAPDLVRSITVNVSFFWVRQPRKSFDKNWMQLHNQ